MGISHRLFTWAFVLVVINQLLMLGWLLWDELGTDRFYYNLGEPPTPYQMIAFYASPECPQGWVEYTNLEGRAIVGLVNNGKLEAQIGVPLADKEERVPYHTHNIIDPGHSHEVTPNVYTKWEAGGLNQYSYVNVANMKTGDVAMGTNSSSTNVKVASTGNSTFPYVQLLACKYSNVTWEYVVKYRLIIPSFIGMLCVVTFIIAMCGCTRSPNDRHSFSALDI